MACLSLPCVPAILPMPAPFQTTTGGKPHPPTRLFHDLPACCLCQVSFFHPQTLCLRQNLIKCIENLEELNSLRELDLYDNQIKKIENLDTLTELE